MSRGGRRRHRHSSNRNESNAKTIDIASHINKDKKEDQEVKKQNKPRVKTFDDNKKDIKPSITMEEIKTHRFVVGKRFTDINTLIMVSNDIKEVKALVDSQKELKAFTNEGILFYPTPNITCKEGVYHIRSEDTKKEVGAFKNLMTAISNCGNGYNIYDAYDYRVY